MNTVSKNHIVDVIQQTTHLNQEAEEIAKVDVNYIESKVEEYSNKSSEYLAGILGAGIGLSGGFAISLAGVAVGFSGPIGLIIGVAGAVLIYRGKGQQKIERANKKVQAVKSKILEDIKALPPDAPQYVKDRLWKMYNNATEVHEKAVIEGLMDDTSKFDMIHNQNRQLPDDRILPG